MYLFLVLRLFAFKVLILRVPCEFLVNSSATSHTDVILE